MIAGTQLTVRAIRAQGARRFLRDRPDARELVEHGHKPGVLSRPGDRASMSYRIRPAVEKAVSKETDGQVEARRYGNKGVVVWYDVNAGEPVRLEFEKEANHGEA